jgi:hypothetical protein
LHEGIVAGHTGQGRRSAARGDREIHARHTLAGGGLGSKEVGMPIDEREAIPTDTPQPEQGPEQDAAVAAQDDWEGPVADQLPKDPTRRSTFA